MVLKVHLICVKVSGFKETNSGSIQTLSFLALPESKWCFEVFKDLNRLMSEGVDRSN